MQRVRCDLARC